MKIWYCNGMKDIIKTAYIILIITTTFSMFTYFLARYLQPMYYNEVKKMRSFPQKKIEAIYKYVEAIETGQIDSENGFSSEPPKQFYKNEPKTVIPVASSTDGQKRYSKPLYVRDKNNPKILHPYKEK